MQARSSATTTRAGADVGAGRAQRAERVGRVEELLRQEAAGRAADEDRLERPPVGHAPGEVDERAERSSRSGPRRSLGSRPRPGDLDENGAGRLGVADRPERVGAVRHDPRDARQGHHVVDEGRVAEEPRSEG